MKDVSNKFPGWEVVAYLNEDIPDISDAHLVSYIEDVESYYRENKRDPTYMQRMIDGSWPTNKKHGRTMYRAGELSRGHTYYLVRVRPRKNELGEVAP